MHNLLDHYRQVRARLNAGPPKVVAPPPAEPKYKSIPTPREIAIKTCVNPVLKKYNITLEDVRSDRRFRMLWQARVEISLALHKHGWSTVRIANFINKDHSSIVYHINGKNL